MNRPCLHFLIAATVSLVLLTAGVTSAGARGTATSAKPYTLAVIPYYAPEKIWALFSPLVDYLKKSTGRPWQLQLYHNHEEFIADMCNGRISVSFTGPIPLARTLSRCGVQPILVALNADGLPTYRSVLVTSDPAVLSVSDLKDRKVGLFKGSTAAHILPAKMLKDAGLPLSSLQPVFLESQDRIMSALLSGELAAGGMKESLYRKVGKETLRVLSTSPPLPNFAFSAHPSFPARERERFVQALTALRPLSDKRDAARVKDWDEEIRHGFVRPDGDFIPSVTKLFSLYREVTNAPQ